MPKDIAQRRLRRAAMEWLESRTMLSAYVVTNNADSGAGSLRQAMLDSNANTAGAPNEIDFAIGTGAQVITLASPLPAVSTPVYLNATSQPGYSNTPLIQINGWGLSIGAGNTTVRGFNIISNNSGPLITLAQNNGDIIQGNWLGTNAAGTAAQGNSQYGIYVNNTANNLIGGTTAAQRNVISGSTAIASNGSTSGSAGIYIFGLNAIGNTVQGNYIGTDATGTAAIGNVNGVDIEWSASHNTIGGSAAGAGNLISGNTARNIYCTNSAYQTQILGNIIGLNASGTAAVNTATNIGIDIEYSTNNFVGGASAATRNVISGQQYGIYTYGFSGTQGAFQTIQGNYIGTDITGVTAIGNAKSGVVLQSQSNTLGGTSASQRNIISGNLVGVTVYVAFNLVEGNYIGLNVNGAALGNTGNGVLMEGVGGNIGGTGAGAGNVISANGNGIVVDMPFGTIQGNFIGTNAAGTAAIGNQANGILVNQPSTNIGGAGSARNVISGNGLSGITVFGTASTTSNVIQGNYLGLNAAGTAGIPNGQSGINIIGAAQTTVGGSIPNVIAFNFGAGITVSNATASGDILSQNSIYSNGGIGIDLGGDGATPNHSGGLVTGPNGLINHPVLSSVVFTGANTTVNGLLNGAASSTFTVEFFASPAGSGTLQGKTYLGNISVTTDASGNATFTATLSATTSGQTITSTASDSAGNTSEFSLGVTSASATVVSRQMFYNNSVYDALNPAANSADDNAIAQGKQALLAGGGTAMLANYSSFSRGINGIIVDVSNLPNLVTASDFSFLSGTNSSPSLWTNVPVPTAVAVRPGGGANGSTRVDITFADGSILNQWLKVTIKSNINTGLGTPDVFYFGSLVGSAIGTASGGVFTVTTADQTSAANDLHTFLTPATIVNVNDFNRDGRVDATDQVIARYNVNTSIPALQIAAGSATPGVVAAAVVQQPAGLAPTSDEVYMWQLINRIRANPSAAATQYGIDLNEGLAAGTISTSPEQPVAMNGTLVQSAHLHSQWMLANQTFSHNEGSVDPQTRMQNAGYVFTAPSGSGENLSVRGTKGVLIDTQMIDQEIADLFTDTSTAGRGHRLNLLNGNFTDVGTGVTTGIFQGFNSLLATQDFAYSAGAGPYLTGVVFNDARIHDNFYEPGEGLGGVTITAVRASDQATFTTTSWPAGAYTLTVPAGTYTVTATGGSLGATIAHSNVVVGAQNVEQDFVPVQPYVAGRFVFYNNSAFDGNNSAANSNDDGAIAPDKKALLPGVPASFANYTSYSRGINGIMVDLGGLPAGVTPVASDFSFKVGNNATSGSWSAGPAPAFMVRPGAGVGGSTRVEFTWADGAIRNMWLQVTVAASGTSGLSTPDVFYFGNAVGESGDEPAAANVGITDYLSTRSNLQTFLNPAGLTNTFDFNRDGRVDATDQVITRNNNGFSLVLFTPVDTGGATSATTSNSLVPAVSGTDGTTRSSKDKNPGRANGHLTLAKVK